MILIICITLFSIQLIIALTLQLSSQKRKQAPSTAKHSGITFIIPFCNEEKRIMGLIKSFNQYGKEFNIEIIFIDDYSTDGTINQIETNLNVPYNCLSNSAEKGKKQAILQGVNQANNEYIITLDADISFSENYIASLFQLPLSDLMILPVRMKSTSFIGKLAIIEFTFMETLNFGIPTPVICYGANLGFKKSTFLELNELRTDYAIKSGDDLFLLQIMQANKKKIKTYNYSKLAVSTLAPTTFKTMIQQRQRWFSKMGHLFRFSTFFALLLLVFVQIASVLCLFMVFFNPIFWFPLAIKFIAELITTWQFIKRRNNYWFVLLAHQFFYPVFLIALLFPLQKEQRWK